MVAAAPTRNAVAVVVVTMNVIANTTRTMAMVAATATHMVGITTAGQAAATSIIAVVAPVAAYYDCMGGECGAHRCRHCARSSECMRECARYDAVVDVGVDDVVVVVVGVVVVVVVRVVDVVGGVSQRARLCAVMRSVVQPARLPFVTAVSPTDTTAAAPAPAAATPVAPAATYGVGEGRVAVAHSSEGGD